MVRDDNVDDEIEELIERTVAERLESIQTSAPRREGRASGESLERRLAELEECVRSGDQPANGANGASSGISRRGMLGAAGALGVAGLLGTADQTRAASAVGSVGSQSSPVDVYANDLEAGLADVEQLRAAETAIGASNGTDDAIPTEPHVDALREGYVVGQAPQEQVVVDPREYPTDADAIQTAHDDLADRLGGHNEEGIVWIPSLRPDGSEYTITKTVVFEGDGDPTGVDVYPRGWGFFGRRSPALQLAITDGSPAFECRGMKGQGGVIGGFRAEGANGGEDCEFLRLHAMTAWKYDRIEVRGIGGPSQHGAIVFDAGCYNSHVDDCRYNSAFEDVTEGNFFAFRDLEGTGNEPGELKFGDGNSTYADPDYPYKHAFDFGDATVSSVLIRGRYEGYGDHAVYATSGSIYLGDGLEFGRVEDVDGTGTSRVYFTGWELSISAGVEMPTKNDTGGPNVYAEPGQGKIDAFVTDDPTGNVIEIPTDTGANKLVVPRPQAFEGSVSYPSTFEQLVYRDGWKRETAGSVTVPSGGSVRIGDWLGRPDELVRVHTRLEDPGEDVFFAVERGFSAGNQQAARIVDRQSTTEYLVHYEVEVKDVD